MLCCSGCGRLVSFKLNGIYPISMLFYAVCITILLYILELPHRKFWKFFGSLRKVLMISILKQHSVLSQIWSSSGYMKMKAFPSLVWELCGPSIACRFFFLFSSTIPWTHEKFPRALLTIALKLCLGRSSVLPPCVVSCCFQMGI